MSLIAALKPLLNAKTAKVALEVSAHPSKDDHMVVVAKPMVGPVPSNASEELKLIVAGLATGIKVVAEAENVEAELVSAITEQAPQRSEWAQRAAQITAAADEAAKKSAAKKTSTATKGASKPADAPAPKEDDPEAQAEGAKGQGDSGATEAPAQEKQNFDIEL